MQKKILPLCVCVCVRDTEGWQVHSCLMKQDKVCWLSGSELR